MARNCARDAMRRSLSPVRRASENVHADSFRRTVRLCPCRGRDCVRGRLSHGGSLLALLRIQTEYSIAIADPANIEIRITSAVTRQVRSLVLPVDPRPGGHIRDIKRPHDLEALEQVRISSSSGTLHASLAERNSPEGIQPPHSRTVPSPSSQANASSTWDSGAVITSVVCKMNRGRPHLDKVRGRHPHYACRMVFRFRPNADAPGSVPRCAGRILSLQFRSGFARDEFAYSFP
jgi:hypothetical protein